MRSLFKSRKLLVAVFMLLAIVALITPKQPAIAQTRWCSNCAQQCWNDANTGENNTAYWRCRDGGGSQSYCDKEVTEKYYNGCVSVTCNYGGGCGIPLIY